MTKVRGTFQEFGGEIVVKDSIEDSTTNVTIELGSVHTRNEQRDGHLRSGDFFDAENSPKMTFVSTAIKPEGDDYVLVSELTIKDVTKPIELESSSSASSRTPTARPSSASRPPRRSAARSGASTSTCRSRAASC